MPTGPQRRQKGEYSVLILEPKEHEEIVLSDEQSGREVAVIVPHKRQGDWRLGFVAVEMDRTGRLLRLEVYDSIV